jgi:hypothetical protein
MKRIISVLAVMVIMAAMFAAMAIPAFAKNPRTDGEAPASLRQPHYYCSSL